MIVNLFSLFQHLEHEAGWICARYKSLLLLLIFGPIEYLYYDSSKYKIGLMHIIDNVTQ